MNKTAENMQRITVLVLSTPAHGELKPYRAVTFGGKHPTRSGQKVLGTTSENCVSEGDEVFLIVIGTCIVETGGPIEVGDDITTDNKGRAISAINPNHYVFGDALGYSSDEGEHIEILLRR